MAVGLLVMISTVRVLGMIVCIRRSAGLVILVIGSFMKIRPLIRNPLLI